MNAVAKKPKKQTRRVALSGDEAIERLISAASELFYEEGIRAIGIDALVERAGVNKMSLYRQFESKDDVVVAYLKRRNATYWDNFDKSVAKHPNRPAEQIVQICKDIVQRAGNTGYRGCAFVNVASEIADESHPARQLAVQHKQELLNRLTALAREAGARDADALGNALALTIEGAYTATHTFGAKSATVRALPIVASALVAAAIS